MMEEEENKNEWRLVFAQSKKVKIFLVGMLVLAICCAVVPLALSSAQSFATDIQLHSREQFVRAIEPATAKIRAAASVEVEGTYQAGTITTHVLPKLVPVATTWRERVVVADAPVTLSKSVDYAHYEARLNKNSTFSFTATAAATANGDGEVLSLLAMTEGQFTEFKRDGHDIHDKKHALAFSFARRLNIDLRKGREVTLTGAVPEDGLTHFIATAGKIKYDDDDDHDDDDEDDDDDDDRRRGHQQRQQRQRQQRKQHGVRYSKTTFQVKNLTVTPVHYATALATSSCTLQPRAAGSSLSSCTVTVPESDERVYFVLSYGDVMTATDEVSFSVTLAARRSFVVLVTVIVYAALAAVTLVVVLSCVRVKRGGDTYQQMDELFDTEPSTSTGVGGAAGVAGGVDASPMETVEVVHMVPQGGETVATGTLTPM